MPQIEVTFDIDANGILHVTAKDKGTGKESKIKIQAGSGLSETEIERMVKDADAHREEDRKQHELVDARNHCDAMIHSVRKALGEHGGKVGADEKGRIEAAIKEAEEAMKGNDKAAIEAKTHALATASQKLGEAIYAQQQAGAESHAAGGPSAAGGATGSKGAEGDVVDAEFTEVKDKK
jgi:molecular chaperone DnaK